MGPGSVQMLALGIWRSRSWDGDCADCLRAKWQDTRPCRKQDSTISQDGDYHSTGATFDQGRLETHGGDLDSFCIHNSFLGRVRTKGCQPEPLCRQTREHADRLVHLPGGVAAITDACVRDHPDPGVLQYLAATERSPAI